MSEQNFKEATSALAFSQSLIDKMRQEENMEEMPSEDGLIKDVPEEPQEVNEPMEEKPEEKIDVEKI